MHKASTASLSSGQASPTIVGPDRESKEIYIISGLVVFLAVVVAGFWYYSQSDEGLRSNRSSETFNEVQVSQVMRDQFQSVPAATPPSTVHLETGGAGSRTAEILHDDIFFEISRKGLTDEGKTALMRHAEFLKTEPDWGVLLQGYTDQQGSISYNKALGLKRAETVKQHLMSFGVPETAIRTVSLGEEGALCIDASDTCRRMNRRVHLELRKVGREHMAVPAVTTPVAAPVLHPQGTIEAENPSEAAPQSQMTEDAEADLALGSSESGDAIEPDDTSVLISPQ